MYEYSLLNSLRDTGKTQYRPPLIKHSNLNKKAGATFRMSGLFYYVPFLFSGQLGIKGALPRDWPPSLRLICERTRKRRFVNLKYFPTSQIGGLFACLLKSLTVVERYISVSSINLNGMRMFLFLFW